MKVWSEGTAVESMCYSSQEQSLVPRIPVRWLAAFCKASSQGYWLVHNVVSPIGLQILLCPWLLSLAPLWEAANAITRWRWLPLATAHDYG